MKQIIYFLGKGLIDPDEVIAIYVMQPSIVFISVYIIYYYTKTVVISVFFNIV